MSINLKVPELKELKPKITVIGVGGAGGNAVNNMIASGLQGVDFIAANTDAQALAMSSADVRIQMGINRTEGLGAGMRPDVGCEAAEEAEEEIRAQLGNSHMIFIAAGMGGGTGTGAAPVIARICKEESQRRSQKEGENAILTVGVVTKPFHFEGRKRMQIAEEGIAELAKYVDTLIVIPNQNLFRIANEKTTFAEAFRLADRVLHAGVGCITDLIIKDGLINLDLNDVRAVMDGMGSAVMGTGQASGERRALHAAEEAIANPLLDEISMTGAKGVLISITGGSDMTLFEVDEAALRIRNEVASDATIIFGATFDDAMTGEIRVSIVASGMDSEHLQKPLVDEEAEAQISADLPIGGTGSFGQPAAGSSIPLPLSQSVPLQSELPQSAQTWQGPGDVRIERRPPQMMPLPEASTYRMAPQRQADEAYVPAPPARATRPPKRMPEFGELPAIAQDEIRSKRGAAARNEVKERSRVTDVLGRIWNFGGQNKPSDSPKAASSAYADQPQVQAQHAHGREVGQQQRRPVNKAGTRDLRNLSGAADSLPRQKSWSEMIDDGAEDIDIPPFLKRGSS